jgi:hypothetical protein
MLTWSKSKPKPKQPKQSTQDQITTPAVQEMKTHDTPTFPAVKEVQSWDTDQLLKWIQQTQPGLLKDSKHERKFRATKIDGSTFMSYAGDLAFFEKTGLPLGIYGGLTALAKRVIDESKFIPST